VPRKPPSTKSALTPERARRRPAAGPLDRKIGARLRAARLAQTLDLPVLATLVGLSPAVLASYEAGQRPIGASTLYELAQALDVPFGRLFAGLDKAGYADRVPEAAAFRKAMQALRDPLLRRRVASLLRLLALRQRAR
jgi:transcriptional regulator with XRE-family HTH domain